MIFHSVHNATQLAVANVGNAIAQAGSQVLNNIIISENSFAPATLNVCMVFIRRWIVQS